MATAKELMQQARTTLLLSQPFFGALALRLRLEESTRNETAWTDGVTMGYNPDFIAKLTPEQRIGLVAHEVMHVASGHPWRRDAREPRKFNVACDHAINTIITSCKMELPPDVCNDPQYAGFSAESIYSQLPNMPPSNGPGDNDPGGCGEVCDCPGDGEGADHQDAETLRTEWEVATTQAAHQAKAKGALPAGLDRLIEQVRKPACRDLISALREFVARAAREDYTYRKPNQRYIGLGMYMPSLYSEQLPPIVAAVDTSGSIDTPLLAKYVAALQTVLDESRPESLLVIACDSAVNSERTYTPGDMVSHEASAYKGGGGTDFRPIFKRIEREDGQPCASVILTDLYGTFPTHPPDYPVLWVVTDPQTQRTPAPFGETIWMDE